MLDPDEELYLSWHGKVTGPFTLEQVRTQLRQRHISSLHKVQVDGEWILLRDMLTELNRSSALRDRLSEVEESAVLRPPIPKAIPVQESPHDSESATVALDLSADQEGHAAASLGEEVYPPNRGLGITAFVVSLFFFVPGLNLICLILALVFGHLSLSGGLTPSGARRAPLPWVATWSSYIHASFLVLGGIWLLTLSAGGSSSDELEMAMIELHGMMFGNAIGACFGAGLLMMAVRLLASYFPPFHVCYVAALLPIAVGRIILLLLSLGSQESWQEVVIASGIAHAVMFILQVLFWAGMIQNEHGKQLGYGHAAVASLFYTIISLFMVFLLMFLVKSLA